MCKLKCMTVLVLALSAAGCSNHQSVETPSGVDEDRIETISQEVLGMTTSEIQVNLDSLRRAAFNDPSDVEAMREYLTLQKKAVEIAAQYAKSDELDQYDELF